jgi:hypothetical protein
MKIFDFLKFKLNEELDFKSIPTDYKIVRINPLFEANNEFDTIYQFTTKSKNSYDVYFSLTMESNHLLSNSKNLHYYTFEYIPTIFFSLTERGLNPLNFDDLTDKNEKFEVMGKIIFLISEFINKHDYKVYSVGEVGDKKYKFYSYYLHNLPNLTMVDGESDNYGGRKCYYLINENRRQS